ncbi:MAG: HAMP domain-containing histidine kinase [gamma proteobacterium symbiont of Lucinoma myriamae]|nr:HAMP domain-containing histidine kinase [gamma proteobacterium symbiont of Lucinoma myriamae]MCU7833183.1 HAMP domain-containing histidine kinase [gamma proteobacterium symbiont of Lucinoma myriamae]
MGYDYRPFSTDFYRINHLISETLSIGLGLEEQNAVTIDINKELDHIINNIKKHGVHIEWSPEQACTLTLAPLALRRIITNLLENAIRYGDEKPVYVNCECNKEMAFIEIMDGGAGIPPEKIEAVFRPFYRLETSRGSSTGGSGLGLAIVKQLADANGWDVQLISRPEGGTKAVLKLP